MNKIGCCTKVKNLDSALKYNIDYVELPLSEIIFSDNKKETIELIKERKINCFAVTKFLNNSIKISSDSFNSEKVLTYIEDAFSTMRELGSTIGVFGNSKSRMILDEECIEEHNQKMISFCKNLGDLAKKYGVTIGIEPLNKKQCNYINTVEEAAKIVKLIDHPNIKIVADFYHMAQENESIESLKENFDLICHVHTAELQNRKYPIYDNSQKLLINTLREMGYNGCISIETENEEPNELINKYIVAIKRDE